jgi:hypothetical protein
MIGIPDELLNYHELMMLSIVDSNLVVVRFHLPAAWFLPWRGISSIRSSNSHLASHSSSHSLVSSSIPYMIAVSQLSHRDSQIVLCRCIRFFVLNLSFLSANMDSTTGFLDLGLLFLCRHHCISGSSTSFISPMARVVCSTLKSSYILNELARQMCTPIQHAIERHYHSPFPYILQHSFDSEQVSIIQHAILFHLSIASRKHFCSRLWRRRRQQH